MKPDRYRLESVGGMTYALIDNVVGSVPIAHYTATPRNVALIPDAELAQRICALLNDDERKRA